MENGRKKGKKEMFDRQESNTPNVVFLLCILTHSQTITELRRSLGYKRKWLYNQTKSIALLLLLKKKKKKACLCCQSKAGLTICASTTKIRGCK